MEWAQQIADWGATFWQQTVDSFGKEFSFPSFFVPLFIACSYLLLRRGWKRRPRFRAVLRGLFPKRVWLAKSTILDMKYVFMNMLIFPVILGTVTLNYLYLTNGVDYGLEYLFGASGENSLSQWQHIAIATVMLYFSYEIAYWLNHYASHKIRFLWEFHKVHHSAEVLTPLTNWRMHPVDSIVFANFVAFFGSITSGIILYLFHDTYTPFSLAGQNVLFVLYFYVLGHLQHSHLWLRTQGLLGHLILSPAHHQIHHSDEARHYNKNFGAALAIWDWMFGTLYIPGEKREALHFGVRGNTDKHHLHKSLAYPFYFATKYAVRQFREKKPIQTTIAAAEAEELELAPIPVRNKN